MYVHVHVHVHLEVLCNSFSPVAYIECMAVNRATTVYTVHVHVYIPPDWSTVVIITQMKCTPLNSLGNSHTKTSQHYQKKKKDSACLYSPLLFFGQTLGYHEYMKKLGVIGILNSA